MNWRLFSIYLKREGTSCNREGKKKKVGPEVWLIDFHICSPRCDLNKIVMQIDSLKCENDHRCIKRIHSIDKPSMLKDIPKILLLTIPSCISDIYKSQLKTIDEKRCVWLWFDNREKNSLIFLLFTFRLPKSTYHNSHVN